ncbi:MAG: hypothetical protein M0R80_30375 [Proteobacteria bacterium]|jgi:hypothetical protein|nr:hypothetical protein [Pseudomonadota bacterium]
MKHATIALCLTLALGCGDDGSSANGEGIELTARLVEGAQTPGEEAAKSWTPLLDLGDPLVGYQLYCVTFADPPAAGTGTADGDGQVVMTLDADGIPFGCFVLDTAGDPVATLIFMGGGAESQTITLTEDTDFGDIDVDLANGVAEGDVGSDSSLTDSSGLTCPLGTWFTEVEREDCEGTTARVWIAQEAAGQYVASYTIGPIWMSDAGACVDRSEAGLPLAESGDTLTLEIQHDPVGCPSRMMTISMTPNAGCTEVAAHGSFGPCLSCEEGQCGCDEGTLICTQDFVLARD